MYRKHKQFDTPETGVPAYDRTVFLFMFCVSQEVKRVASCAGVSSRAGPGGDVHVFLFRTWFYTLILHLKTVNAKKPVTTKANGPPTEPTQRIQDVRLRCG